MLAHDARTLAAIIDGVSDAILLFDEERRIVLLNRPAERAVILSAGRDLELPAGIGTTRYGSAAGW